MDELFELKTDGLLRTCLENICARLQLIMVVVLQDTVTGNVEKLVKFL